MEKVQNHIIDVTHLSKEMHGTANYNRWGQVSCYSVCSVVTRSVVMGKIVLFS
jgi:hypothetical protein